MGSTAGSCESSLWGLAASRLTLGLCCVQSGCQAPGGHQEPGLAMHMEHRGASDPPHWGGPHSCGS